MKLHMRGCGVHTAVVFSLVCCIARGQDWKTEIGYTALQARLGSALPTGEGIPVTQVEGTEPNGAYHANTASAEFTGKTFYFECDVCNNADASSHATTVGTYFYGNFGSLAPGIGEIGAEEVVNWLNTALRTGSDSPAVEARRIHTHAWIGSTGNPSTDNLINRRFDLMLHRDGVVASVGVDNAAGSPIPALMSSSYNAIAVGRSSGGSSYGPVVANLDGAGRVKPDLVVPTTATSWGTGVVASAAAMLLHEENRLNVLSSLPSAQRKRGRALLAKALLMAGCTREEFTCLGGWRKGFAIPSTDGSVPLDYRFGAGELNVDHSHRILTTHPQQTPSSSAVRMSPGWNFTSVTGGSTHAYFIDVPAGKPRELSILVTWNRQIGAPPALAPSLANLDLRLFQASGFVKGSQVDQSVSTIDNVEFVVMRPIPPGRYVFEITASAAAEYAVAWDLRPLAATDLDHDGDVDGDDVALFEACATRSGVPAAAGCTAVDFDGDGDGDLDDFAMLQRCYSGACVPVNPTCTE